MFCDVLCNYMSNLVSKLKKDELNNPRPHFVFGILSIIAEQIDITETDLNWLDLHIETVKHLARVYISLCTTVKYSAAAFEESINFANLKSVEEFLQNFTRKMQLVANKILTNIYTGHLPAEDIMIICKHYDDARYVLECVTGNKIQLPSYENLTLLLRKFYISVKKVNKL